MVYMGEGEGSKQIYLASSKGVQPQALTQGTNWHLYPDIDSAGRRVAYVEGKNEKVLDVMILDRHTKDVYKLTDGEGRFLHPDFSGNGKMIAASGPMGPQKQPRIVVWKLERDKNRFVVPSEHDGYFPAISGQGDFLVYQENRGDKHKVIVKYDLGAKKASALTDENGVAMAPALSFDDVKVAYTSFVEGNWDVFVKDLMNNKIVRVTNDKGRDFAPTFRPDGSIVFASDRAGHFQLYEISAKAIKDQTYAANLLVSSKEDLYAPSVSGDIEAKQTTLPPIPKPARSSFGAAKIGDNIYILGGHQGVEHTYPPESFLDEVWSYNIPSQSWKKMKPRPVPCHGYGVATQGKYIYAFGGFAYSAEHLPKWKSLDSIDRYDTTTDEWVTVGTLPRRRSSNVVATVGNKVYLMGGWDATPKFPKDFDGTFHREVDVFDLDKQEATKTDIVVPNPLRRALSGLVYDDTILLIGGLGQGASHFELLDQVTAFKPETGEWRELPKLPFATFAPAAGVVNDTLLVFGGMFKTGPMEFKYVDHVFALDNAEGWKHTGRYLSEPKGFAQVVELDANTLAILGGHSGAGEDNAPVPTFETYGVAR